MPMMAPRSGRGADQERCVTAGRQSLHVRSRSRCPCPARRWSDVANDPNDPVALAARAAGRRGVSLRRRRRHRVRAAQLGIVWKNADQVLLAFPTGMAELAERHGLVLSEAAVTDDRTRLAVREVVKAARRRIRSRQWTTVGYATIGRPGERRVGYGALGRVLHGMWWPRRRFVGETFIYVLTSATDRGTEQS